MSSYISSLFSRDPVASFPYEVTKTVLDDPDRFLWTVCEGRKKFRDTRRTKWALFPVITPLPPKQPRREPSRKGTNELVTVFCLDVKLRSDSQVDLAKSTLKRLKTLRHPNIVTFLDSLETDKLIYLVTEPCCPLEVYLQETKLKGTQKEMAASWGLYQISNAVKFLSQEAKLIHNNINWTSVFVTNSGEWKLCGFEYTVVFTANSYIPSTKPYALEKYIAPEIKSGNISATAEPWSIDMWGLACLIWEVFNGALPNPGVLKFPKRIPKSLHSVYAPMISANPARRPSPEDFAKECRKPHGFMRNKFVDTLLFLEEFQLKEAREKSQFFSNLKEHLDLFPPDVAKNKILPQLIQAYQYGDAGSSVLTPLFRLSKLLNEQEYQDKIVPCIVKLFSSPDRATRVKLLEKIEEFVEHLGPPVVNDKIFPNLKSGFLDTNLAVRESTVKAMIYLAPKLNYQNMNVELMGHFARLQGKDDQPGIRTNTTICLGKVACYIHPSNRQKILISAFTRAMRDPFPPSRVAGILALSATQQYYQLTEIAQKILPALASLTVDPEKNVRDQAFKSFRGFLEKLEKASENPELIPELEAGVQAGSGGGILSPEKVPQWASWALSAISGKFYKAPPQQTEEQTVKTATEEEKKSESKMEGPEKKTEGWSEDEEWGKLDESEERKSPVIEESTNERPKRVEPRMKLGKPDEKHVSWDEDDDEAEEDSKPWTGWDDVEVPKEAKKLSSGVSGMKLGGSGKLKSVVQQDEDSFLDELLGENTASKKQRDAGFNKQKAAKELSASTALGPTGPIRTTLDKKKTSVQAWGTETESGWDFDDEKMTGGVGDAWVTSDGDWGTGAGWGLDDFGESKTQHRRSQKSAEQRRAEIEQKRQAKAGGSLKLGAKKLAKD